MTARQATLLALSRSVTGGRITQPPLSRLGFLNSQALQLDAAESGVITESYRTQMNTFGIPLLNGFVRQHVEKKGR